MSEGVHLVLYDGVCGLCSRLVQFILTHDDRGVFRFASLQSATGRAIVERAGGNAGELRSLYVVPDYERAGATALVKNRAVFFAVRQLGWPWRAAALLGFLPDSLLDFGYDLIARYRYRIFGRREQCLVPTVETRKRFVDF